MDVAESHGQVGSGRPDRLEIDVQGRELLVNGSAIPISGRAFAVLQTLVEACGAAVTKSDLMSRVWADVVVGDTALQVQISAIRKALGVNGALLRTISGKGYRLLGDWGVRKTARSTQSAPLTLNLNSAEPHKTNLQGGAAISQPIYRCDECEIDLSLRQVRIRGVAVPIGGRAFDILAVLVQAANEVVNRGDLLQSVWSGVIVGETAIDVHISAIRKALGSHRAMLKTISGLGFRLVGAWTVQTSQVPTPPPSLTRSTISTNLPAAANELIGRAASFEFLQEACSAYRIVTLTGPGGIGKTVLAIDLARGLLPRFDAGVWLVELASLADPSLLPAAVGEAIGLQANGRPMSAEGVARVIGHDRLLVVLDNCEHLVGAAAQFAEAIVRLAPNAVIVATSRETLKINGERVYRVPPLEVPQHESSLPDEIISNSAVQMFLSLTEAPYMTGLRDESSLRSIGIMDIDEFAHAVRVVHGGATLRHLDVAPAAMRIEGDEEIDGPVAAVLVIIAFALSRSGRDRLTHLADELDGRFVEADQRPLGIWPFGIQFKHVLHARDVFTIDGWNAPHVPTPGLEVVFRQPAPYRLARQAVVISEFDHRIGQQGQGPAFATGGRLRARRCHQKGFFLARQLAFRAGTRLLAQGPLQIAFDEATLGSADGGKADLDRSDDPHITAPGIGRQQNLGALQLAGSVLAATEQRRQFLPLGLAQLDPITYIHASPPCRRPGRIQR